MAEPGRLRGREWTVGPHTSSLRLAAFLSDADRLGSRGRAARALSRGQVFVNDREMTPADASRVLAAGDRVRLWMDRPGSASRRVGRAAPVRGVSVVYEDERLVVVDKPSGLLTVPLPRRPDQPSVADWLRVHLGTRPLAVHRIDRDTSGLVVFARRVDTQQALRDQFHRGEPERVYLAFVRGVPHPQAGEWQDYLVWDVSRLKQTARDVAHPEGRRALCRYRVIESYRDAALLEIRLVTGLRNQIRLQAQLRGHALLGERQYATDETTPARLACPRQALHACRLGFRHPASGQMLHVEAPLPSDLDEVRRRLRRSVVRGRTRRP